jgi:Uma2 family endonuclease
LNTAYALKTQLNGSDCDVFAMDVKAEIVPKGKYLYPDILLTCDRDDLENEGEMMVRSPKLIVEVLSENTEDRDRNDKFKSYIKIPSLQYYLLVAQNEKRVDVYSRQPHDFWHFKSYLDAGAKIPLSGLNLELLFSQIYQGVKF